MRSGPSSSGTSVRRWHGNLWPNRLAPAILALGVGWLCCPVAAGAECIDYGDYLHWCGGVDTPGEARGVAVTGTHAYVADSNSQVSR
jgi:hypothetical protein